MPNLYTKNLIFKIKNLEIGSNDEFLCDLFKKKGAQVIGIDASKFMTKISAKKNIKSINSIFNFKESKKK